MAERKVIVIGLDALTPELAWPWAAEGILPNLARIIAEGARGPLRSTLPPCSPAAWSTFATGTNPGKHGIVDFHQFPVDDYRPRLMTAAQRRGEAFWEVAGRHGIRGGVLNLPLSFPVRPFNGFIVAGMMTPRLGRSMASPPEVFDDLVAASPDYAIDIDVMGTAGGDPEKVLDRTLAVLRARCKAAVGLYRKHRPALFCVVFVAADRVCHFFWPYLEAGRSGRDLTAKQRRLADAVKTTYAALDEAVGALLHEADAETDVVILSDHGAGALHSGLSLRKALADAGLLAERSAGPLGRWSGRAVRAFARRAPRALKRRIASLLPDLERKAAATAAGEGIDYRRSLTYPMATAQSIFVNVRGRQPCGVVEPGAEYEEVRARVIAALSQLRDPRTGRPVLRGVHKREDVWSGPRLDGLPDLVVEPEEYDYSMRTFGEPTDCGVFYSLPETDWSSLQRAGGHRPDGVLMAAGPHVRHVELSGAAIADVPATVLALLGCPIPDDFDGRVLSEMLTDDVQLPARGPALAGAGSPAEQLAPRDEAAVKERLEGLGYL